MKSKFKFKARNKKMGFRILMSACVISSTLSVQAQSKEDPTLVLVHGAHFSGNAWAEVQHVLNKQFKNVAVNLPGREDKITPHKVTMALSAGSLCQSLGRIQGNKIIIAHSQGGAIVNESLNVCPSEPITKIIYVTAVSPLNNSEVFSKLSKKDETNYFKGVHFNEPLELLEIGNKKKFANNFAQDATPSQRDWLNEWAVPEPAPVGGSKIKLNKRRFDAIDKYYVFTEQDKIISMESQQNIADSLNLKGTYSINSGHLPMLTHSQELGDILIKASLD